MPYLVPVVHPAALLRGGHPIADIIRMDLAKARRLCFEPYWQPENIVVVHPSNPVGLAKAVEIGAGWIRRWIGLGCPVAVDVETSSLNYFNCNLYSIALSGADDRNTAVAFTLADLRTLPWDAEQVMLQALRDLLAAPQCSKVFHNAPYDFAVLTKKGYSINGPIEDTQGYAHLQQPDVPKDLGFVGHTWLDVEPWKMNHQTGKKQAFTKDVIELLVYNAKDALNTMKLRAPLLAACAEHGVSSELIFYQNAFARLAAQMELVGLPINFELRRSMGRELLGRLEVLKQRMREYLKWPEFNPMNKNHAVIALYDKTRGIGLMPTAWTEKTKQPSTKYEHIIDHMQHPFVKDFIDYVENHHGYATQYREAPQKSGDPEPGAYTRAVQADGRLHAKWNPTGQKGSRFSSEPNCFSADTELLTPDGWVGITDVVADATNFHVAQFDPKTDKITFAKPTDPVRSRKRAMLDLDGTQIHLRVTPNHRMLLREYNPNRHPRLAETKQADTLPQHRRFVHAGQFVFGKHKVGKALMRFIVACQADGSWQKQVIRFDLKKRVKYTRLRELLDALHADYTYRERPRAPKHRYDVRVQHSALTQQVLGYIGRGREWGSWLLDITREDAEVFLAELGHWDGRVLPNRYMYYSSKKTNADWAQIVAALLGHRAPMTNAGTCWRVTIQPGTCFSSARVRPKTVRKPETAYCVSVPTGFLVVRRQHKVIICGNCQNQRPKDRAFFEAPDGRVFVGADKDALELRLAAVFSGVQELIHEMTRPGGDPHRLAAINVYGDVFTNASPELQKRLRDAIKTTVYASLYRAGVKTVHKSIRKKKFLDASLRAALTLEEVERIYHSYFGKYVEIPVWHDRNYTLAQTQFYLECPPLGRRRYFPVQPPPYTEVANWPIQTAGSDAVGMEMVQIQDELIRRYHGSASIVLHGHDAVYVECNEGDAMDVAKIVNRIFGATPMTGPAGPLALTATAKICKNLRFSRDLDKVVTVPRE